MTDSPHTSSESPLRSPDRDLLRRFVQDGDEVAFAQIVERHASLVMSVCRRVVGQSADVDDAFQATFFALSRRPHSIYECRSLSGWLYSVAWRTSVRLVRLRKKTMMQSLPEQIPATEPDPLDVIAQSSDLATLDEELNYLPEKFRDVLVMSYFAQQTNQEIADQLNESKGTVDGRIRDARRMLRVRLARRGVEVGALTVAATLTQSSASAVSPQLIQTAAQFGSLSPGLAGTDPVTGVDLARLKLLTSTGNSVMGIKTGIAIAAGFLALSGAFGMTRLAATMDGGPVGDGRADESAVIIAGGEADGDSALPAGDAVVLPEVITAGGGIGSDLPAVDAAVLPRPVVVQDATTSAATPDALSAPSAAAEQRNRPRATAEFSRASTRDAERRLHEVMLTERIPQLDFGGTTALREILDSISHHLNSGSSMMGGVPGMGGMIGGAPGVGMAGMGASSMSGPGMSAAGTSVGILLDESDPDIGEDPEYLDSTQISGVYFPAGSMTIASALEMILEKVKDNELTWIVDGEVVLITTVATAESEDHLLLRSYDISKLRPLKFQKEVTMPDIGGLGGGGLGGGGFGGGGFGGGGQFQLQDNAAKSTDEKPTAEEPQAQPQNMGQGPRTVSIPDPNSWDQGLVTLIMDMTSPPCLWIQNGDDIGSMSVAGNRLFVRQSRMGHESVVEVLEQLELAAEEMEENPPTAGDMIDTVPTY